MYRWGTDNTGCSSLYIISIAYVQTIFSLQPMSSQYPSVHPMSSLNLMQQLICSPKLPYRPCPDSTASLQTISSQYRNLYTWCQFSSTSIQPMSRQYPISTANTQAVSYLYIPYPDSTQYLNPMSSLYSQCPDCTSLLQPKSSQYPNVFEFSPCLAFTHFTSHVKWVNHLYSTHSDRTSSSQVNGQM